MYDINLLMLLNACCNQNILSRNLAPTINADLAQGKHVQKEEKQSKQNHKKRRQKDVGL